MGELIMDSLSSCLVSKSCTPCQGGISPLEAEKINELLKEIGNKWTLNKVGHLGKEFLFEDFISSVIFTNKIAEVSEKEG